MELIVARRLADATLEQGASLGLAPLAVAVLDAGGHMLVGLRDERAGIMRLDIALAKAWGSLGMGFGSRTLAKRTQDSPNFFAALNEVSAGRLAPSPGGILLYREGRLVGAIGISGDTGDRDEMAGLKAAGLVGLETAV